jgi:hypothetical protein
MRVADKRLELSGIFSELLYRHQSLFQKFVMNRALDKSDVHLKGGLREASALLRTSFKGGHNLLYSHSRG